MLNAKTIKAVEDWLENKKSKKMHTWASRWTPRYTEQEKALIDEFVWELREMRHGIELATEAMSSES